MGDNWSVLIPQCCIGHCGEWEICQYCPHMSKPIEIDDIKFKACLEILDKFMDELDHSLLYGKARD